MNTLKSKVVAVGIATVALLGIAQSAFAAADADVLSAASTTVNTLKENIFGAITANIGTIAVIAGILVTIMVIYRLLRRMIGR